MCWFAGHLARSCAGLALGLHALAAADAPSGVAAQVEAALLRADALRHAAVAEAAAWQAEEAALHQRLAQAQAAQAYAQAAADAAHLTLAQAQASAQAATALAQQGQAQASELAQTIAHLRGWLDRSLARLPAPVADPLRPAPVAAGTTDALAELASLVASLHRLDQANRETATGTAWGRLGDARQQVRFVRVGLAAWWWMDSTGTQAGPARLGDDGLLVCLKAPSAEAAAEIIAAFEQARSGLADRPLLLPLADPPQPEGLAKPLSDAAPQARRTEQP